MKSKILILFFLLTYLTSKSQTIQLKIIGQTTFETKIIDSIGYSKEKQNTKQIIEEINTISKKLSETGYINNQLLDKIKENNSSYSAKISLGQKIKHIHIYIGAKNNSLPFNLFETNKDSITLPYSQTEVFLKHTLQNLEKNGYAFAKIKLINIQQRNQNLYADLSISTSNRRNLNSIEIKYSDQQQKKIFPKGAEKQISKKYKNKIFNQETVQQISLDFEEFGFVSQIKFPEILFTQDTTKVFVYLEKRKANNFDGYLGFNNEENEKVKFNGYLDLTLVNALRNGEELSIYWKNDGNNQKLFNANLNIPYLFNSPIAIKAQINIFKQDSIFQNTKTALQLGYFLNYNKRIYLGFESTESSDIQNLNSQNITDYKNTFYTSTVEYKKNNTKNKLLPTKSYLNLILGTGNRTTTTNPSLKQNFINLNLMNDFYIDEKNIITFKSQNYYLKSKDYITNELYRFGGINSIRGFSENSLQANLMLAVITEYKYLLSPSLYLNSILDYCYYEDPTLSSFTKNEKLLGIGLGLGAQTLNGLLKFAISNGKTKNEELKFSNTIVTINYNVKF
ncbi:hypothetical protein [Flavobacterium sp. WC2509]|uniref:hypothetical protein n=1 Tax=Flavobacterium sp. WC2509 TaxID=3461406 RepID=UPI0040440CC3